MDIGAASFYVKTSYFIISRPTDRGFLSAKCEHCEHVPLCGGGCPLYNQMAEVCCPDSKSNT